MTSVLRRLMGGRPMTLLWAFVRLHGPYGAECSTWLHLYRDRLGREWYARSAWALKRWTTEELAGQRVEVD